MEAKAKFCAHCGWGNPEMIAKGKRMRLEGCGLMVAALLSCAGGCATISSGLITSDIWFHVLVFAVAVGGFGLVKWWLGLGFYDGK